MSQSIPPHDGMPPQPPNGYAPYGAGPWYGSPYPMYEQPPMPHAGLGIASFFIAVAVGLGMAVTFVVTFVVIFFEVMRTGGVPDQTSPTLRLSSLFMCGCVLMNLVGVGLGIGALFQSNRRQIFSILGLIFNAMTVLGFVGLSILGLVMQ